MNIIWEIIIIALHFHFHLLFKKPELPAHRNEGLGYLPTVLQNSKHKFGLESEIGLY